MSTGVSSSTLKLFKPSNNSTYPAFYSNVFSGMVDNNSTEETVNYINTSFKNNIVSCTNISENKYITTPDGSKFLRIFSHDVRNNSEMFKDEESAKFNVHSANKFSTLEDIPLFTTNDSTQVGVSGIQSRVDGTNL